MKKILLCTLLFAFLLGCVEKPMPSKCGFISEIAERDECIREVAVEERDISLCYKISDLRVRENCIEQVTNPYYRPTVAPPPKPSTPVVAKPPEPKKEEKIVKLIEISNCAGYREREGAEECYLAVALATKSPEVCGKIATMRRRTNCLNFVSATKDENLEKCMKAVSAENSYICYYTLALIKNDLGICDEYGEKILGADKDACYSYVGAGRLDTEICDMISGSKVECYAKNAIYENNAGICEGLVSEDERGSCYFEYAKAKGTERSICEKVSPELKEECDALFR